MRFIGEKFIVPANSSRFFKNAFLAQTQKCGEIQLGVDFKDPYVRNVNYNEKLIRYDYQYCTSVQTIDENYEIPTLKYVRKYLDKLNPRSNIVEIGCGQGELVNKLRQWGFNASGYDPVLRHETNHLFSKYWDSSVSNVDFYIMRCVLPHIRNPWEFIDSLAINSQNAYVLIEFQRIEWIVDLGIWYGISHDHVNYFSIQDFKNRFKVVDCGTFSGGEWAWVLIKTERVAFNEIEDTFFDLDKIEKLLQQKSKFLETVIHLNRPIAIWGGAGKGIVLSHSLSLLGLDCLIVDADINRWDLYVEGSGFKIISPKSIFDRLSSETLILVCNPNHTNEIRKFVGTTFELKTANDLTADNA